MPFPSGTPSFLSKRDVGQNGLTKGQLDA
eukprot:COSAG02_NODE_30069_length_557_cov_189.015284_1_plen_28_part_01